MDTLLDGIALFGVLLIAFGLLGFFGYVVEQIYFWWCIRRDTRELLPPPNVRSQRRGRQWQVPL